MFAHSVAHRWERQRFRDAADDEAVLLELQRLLALPMLHQLLVEQRLDPALIEMRPAPGESSGLVEDSHARPASGRCVSSEQSDEDSFAANSSIMDEDADRPSSCSVDSGCSEDDDEGADLDDDDAVIQTSSMASAGRMQAPSRLPSEIPSNYDQNQHAETANVAIDEVS